MLDLSLWPVGLQKKCVQLRGASNENELSHDFYDFCLMLSLATLTCESHFPAQAHGFRTPSKRKLILGWFWNAFEKDTHFNNCAPARTPARKITT